MLVNFNPISIRLNDDLRIEIKTRTLKISFEWKGCKWIHWEESVFEWEIEWIKL